MKKDKKEKPAKAVRKSAKVLIILAYVFPMAMIGYMLIFPFISRPGMPFMEYIKFYLPYEFSAERIAEGTWIPIVICLVWFCVFGIISHVLMKKDLNKNDIKPTKGEKFLYIISFLPYAVPFILLFILWAILKFVDIMLQLFTGKDHPLARAIDFLAVSAGFKKKSSFADASDGGAGGITVMANGFDRKLTFAESSQDHCSDSPYFLKYYNRFRDDLGNYWRSYDNNDTFIPEKNIPGSTSYIG